MALKELNALHPDMGIHTFDFLGAEDHQEMTLNFQKDNSIGIAVLLRWVHTVDGRNPFRTTLKPWLKPLFVGIYRGILIPVVSQVMRNGFRPSTVPGEAEAKQGFSTPVS